ncbi:hypothetical protein [Streptomyces sp. WMMB 322]|uniref:hypothetical protein n=1 Tax=Streptomyces sp. WMMB 322 TaxID=1286821 RepID=UPI0006E15A8C|nr:hypothetical protein [Streptomyces sp. WMMB 322]SCK48887.1 ABC-type branched-chain amino acid transport system, substrate-binding protein [Streptomyces sp. WMMB 322]
MSQSIPPLTGVDQLIESLEELIKVPPGRRGPSPRVLLSQPAEGPEAERLAAGLCKRLHVSGRALVPYAEVAGPTPEGQRERIGAVFQKVEQELKRNRPAGSGKLRLPQFALMCSVVETDLVERQPPVRARELRDQCFAERRKDSGFLRALEMVSGGDQPPATGGPALAWYYLRQPVLNLLPRWIYGRIQERRMGHGGSWYSQWQNLPKSTRFFEDACKLAGGGTEPRADRTAWMEETTGALLRALLADLDAAFRRRWFSPWRRRRRTRFTVVLPQTDWCPEWTAPLVRDFPLAVEQTGSTGVVLVAAERSYGERPQRSQNTADAAGTLKSWSATTGGAGARVVRVGLEPQDPDRDIEHWLDRHPKIDVRVRTDAAPLAEAVTGTLVVLSLLACAGAYAVSHGPHRGSTECLGSTAAAGSAPPEHSQAPPGKEPRELYEETRAGIGKENEEAEEAGKRPDAVVRTVVYLGVPTKVGSWDDAMYSGAIPELRGIALAQEKLNHEAARDRANKVLLRVRIEDAGAKFHRGPAIAKQIAKEVDSGKGEEIVGVVGLGQSRQTTMETRDILGDAGVPMIGTVATAQEMQRHSMYRQVAPDNGREARIAADFARRGNIVRTGPGTCAPAEKAVVIADPGDAYSDNLSRRFTQAFGDTHTLWYSPDGKSHGPSAEGRGDVDWVGTPMEMATEVCRLLKAEARTVVYWAARSNEFSNFLADFDGGTACNGRVTVLGGNDLTNSVVEKQRPSQNHPGIRLYYAAHALPKSYPPNLRAETFRADYAAKYKTDQWSNDGHAPLSWDAMQVLSHAVDSARQDAEPAAFDRGTVQAALVNGPGGEAGVRGASGSLVFGHRGEVPRNKRLLILHETRRGPEVSLECGVRDSGVEQKAWGKHGEFKCPQDEDQ